MIVSNTILINWVKSAAEGDEGSWYALYRQFHPAMFATALRICKDSELAADSLQDAFVTAYLKLSQLRDLSAFAGWLRQIVTHACYRSLSLHNGNVSLDMLLPDNHRFRDDELSEKAEELARQRRLHGALAALPSILQSTVLLRYFSSYQGYNQIAAILKIPVGTVRSRLNEAKNKLAEYWRRHQAVSDAIFYESEEWNAFYFSAFGGMHADDTCKKRFLSHIAEGIITFPDGKQVNGSATFENMLAEDQQVGSWLKPVNVISNGSVSIIESVHINSTKHPNHCPASSVITLFRKGGKVSQLFLHTSKK